MISTQGELLEYIACLFRGYISPISFDSLQHDKLFGFLHSFNTNQLSNGSYSSFLFTFSQIFSNYNNIIKSKKLKILLKCCFKRLPRESPII